VRGSQRLKWVLSAILRGLRRADLLRGWAHRRFLQLGYVLVHAGVGGVCLRRVGCDLARYRHVPERTIARKPEPRALGPCVPIVPDLHEVRPDGAGEGVHACRVGQHDCP
jgi:hypothetical protein